VASCYTRFRAVTEDSTLQIAEIITSFYVHISHAASFLRSVAVKHIHVLWVGQFLLAKTFVPLTSSTVFHEVVVLPVSKCRIKNDKEMSVHVRYQCEK
jgi:hypothetical protein